MREWGNWSMQASLQAGASLAEPPSSLGGKLLVMCGRFTATAAFDVLAERFGITIDEGTTEELTARYNVSPSQAVPIIVNRSRARPPLVASGRRLVMAKWGFRPVAIARTYGWRVKSEVFPLQRRHLDLKAGILRLDPGTTKNSDGRVVYLTMELKRLLSAKRSAWSGSRRSSAASYRGSSRT
jgi:hypothetical protein